MLNPWLLVVLFLIHDGEEVLFLPEWVNRHSLTFDNLERQFPVIRRVLPLLRHSNQKQFSISVFLLLLILALISGASAMYPNEGWIQTVFLSGLVIFTVHLLGHVAQSIALHQVIPGAITSVLVFAPCAILWKYQADVMHISFGTSLLYGLIGAAIGLPLFPLILKFGQWAGKSL